MAKHKTPGIYIQDNSILPPSVSLLETAIPVFIGYTEMASLIEDDDLLNISNWKTLQKSFHKDCEQKFFF